MTFFNSKVNDKQDFWILKDAMTHTKLFFGEKNNDRADIFGVSSIIFR